VKSTRLSIRVTILEHAAN